MTDFNDILNSLRNGEDLQAIADKFADELNAANKAYQDECAAEKNAIVQEQAKYDSAKAVASAVNAYINEFYPEWGVTQVTADEIVELTDAVDELYTTVKGIGDLFGAKVAMPEKKPKSSSSSIADFLRENGLM